MPAAPTPLIVNTSAPDPYPEVQRPVFGNLTTEDVKEMVSARDWQLALAAAHIAALEKAFDEQAQQIAALKAALPPAEDG